MPAAGSKGAPKNQGELKDDTNSSREEKKVACYFSLLSVHFNIVFILKCFSEVEGMGAMWLS